MQQSQGSSHLDQRRDGKALAIDAVLSFVLKHHDWSIPHADTNYWGLVAPELSNQRVRALLMQHAEEGRVIRVIARELPDPLRLRPPSWMDLGALSIFPSSGQMMGDSRSSRCSSFAHFIPSPAYLATLPLDRFDSPHHHAWIVHEAQRVWWELQREETRVLVKTNVPNQLTGVIDALTSLLAHEVRMYPTIHRESVHAAVSTVTRGLGLSFPIEEHEKREVLRLARERLLKGRDGTVMQRFNALSRPRWGLTS